MRIPDARPFPRPCQISSHQFHIEGMCLVITTTGHAIVELANGDVGQYLLTKPDGLFSMKFIDRGSNA